MSTLILPCRAVLVSIFADWRRSLLQHKVQVLGTKEFIVYHLPYHSLLGKRSFSPPLDPLYFFVFPVVTAVKISLYLIYHGLAV